MLREIKYRINEYPFKDITEKIILCAREIHSNLGPGLLESVYEEALGYEFDLREIKYQRQREIGLRYKGKIIGNHRLDFLVEGEIILEIKASDGISDIYIAQVLTYLRATKKRVGLLINFNVERLKDGLRRLIV